MKRDGRPTNPLTLKRTSIRSLTPRVLANVNAAARSYCDTVTGCGTGSVLYCNAPSGNYDCGGVFG